MAGSFDERVRRLERLAAGDEGAAAQLDALLRQAGLLRTCPVCATDLRLDREELTCCVEELVQYYRLDDEQEQALKDLFTGDREPESFESVDRWVRQAYHRPAEDLLVLEAANEVLEGHGIEDGRGRVGGRGEAVALYVNMGDSYAPTVLLDLSTRKWAVTSWGDWVEEHERALALTPEERARVQTVAREAARDELGNVHSVVDTIMHGWSVALERDREWVWEVAREAVSEAELDELAEEDS